MKKRMTRLAAAAVLACAGVAHAQSSVTMWGIVDLNVQHFNATGVGHLNGLGNGSLSTSQIGFRGIEDLGGGLRAAFWLEGSLNPDTGTGRNSNVNNQPSGAVNAGGGFTFDRRSYAALAGQWGEVRLGHDFVPTHYNSIPFDVAGAVSHTPYASTAVLGDYTHINLGASYDAKFARFFALVNEVKVEVVNGPIKKDAWVIGAHVPVGPGRLRFTYGRLDDRSAGRN